MTTLEKNYQEQKSYTEQLSKDVSRILEERRVETLEVVKRLFADAVEEEDQWTGGSGSWYLRRKRGERFEDIATIHCHDSWKREEEDQKEKPRLSFYTTSESSKFEIDRVITLGKVAQILKDNYETFGPMIQDIEEKYEVGLKNARESYYNAEREELRIATEIDNVNRDQFLTQLETNGVSFKKQVEVEKRATDVYRANEIKVLGYSKSGKNVDLELTTHNESVRYDDNWNPLKDENGMIIKEIKTYKREVRILKSKLMYQVGYWMNQKQGENESVNK